MGGGPFENQSSLSPFVSFDGVYPERSRRAQDERPRELFNFILGFSFFDFSSFR